MRDTELREQLRQTEQLVANDPTTLVMQRQAPAGKSPAGGPIREGGWSDQPPIEVFFGAKTRDGMPLQDSQGDRTILYYTIVGMPGTDVQPKDKFTHLGVDYVVKAVHRNLAYEVKADVESYIGR